MDWLTDLLERLITKAASLWAAFSAGQNSVKNEETKHDLEVAKKRLDIANRPDPSVDDIVDWMSGKTPDKD